MSYPVSLATSTVAKLTTLMTEYNLDLQGALRLYNEEVQDVTKAKNALLDTDITELTKPEIIELTWKLPELPEHLFDLLTEQGGFKTGSSVIADLKDPNDLDYCVIMPPHVFEGYTLGQAEHGYWEADGFGAIYAHYKGKLLNIICFSDELLFEAWFFATKAMENMKSLMIPQSNTWRAQAHLTHGDLFETKWKRVILFRALKDIAYEPRRKKPMDQETAAKFNKCKECSREAIYFTCKAARTHYEKTTVCERCAGITY